MKVICLLVALCVLLTAADLFYYAPPETLYLPGEPIPSKVKLPDGTFKYDKIQELKVKTDWEMIIKAPDKEVLITKPEYATLRDKTSNSEFNVPTPESLTVYIIEKVQLKESKPQK